MTSRTAETSPPLLARVAGGLYLSLVPLALLGFPYGPSQLFVPGDAATTARNILANASLLRLSILLAPQCADLSGRALL